MKRYLVGKDRGDEGGKKLKGGEEQDEHGSRPDMPSKTAPRQLRVVSWNLDGLDPSRLRERTERACDVIIENGGDGPPDAILLQEVVASSADILIARLGAAGYTLAPEPVPRAEYFTLLFVGSTLKVKKALRTPFSGSTMGRDLVEVTASVDDRSDEIVLMTAHFESLGDKNYSRQRCLQLSDILTKLTACGGPALFAGDTNLREKEVAQEPRYRQEVDAWVAAGSSADTKATWDLQLNDNKRMPGPSQPRCRYDRMLMNKNICLSQGSVKSFRLLGTTRVPVHSVFPSDHFGISCTIELPS